MVGKGLSLYCPHCHRHISVASAPVEVESDHESFTVGAAWKKDSYNIWWIGVCNFCASLMLICNGADVVYPSPRPMPTDESIPESIRHDLDEAKQCLSVSAWRASAVMARRAMQAAAIAMGGKGDKLHQQILDLASSGKITSDLKEWADAVRWVGNDAAHPGGNQVSDDEADEVLKLADQFLHVLYVAPAIAQRIRDKRSK